MIENYEIRAKARKALSNNWMYPILACLIFYAITGLIGSVPVIGWIVGIAITGPLLLGLINFYLEFVRKGKKDLNVLFSAFKINMVNAILLQIVTTVFTFLWSLLFIIPGIIAMFSYSQVFYLLKDNPNMEFMEAIKKSKELMRGKKWKLFCLRFSFIGWAILSFLTLGIGFIFLAPYVVTSEAIFYEELIGKSSATTAKEEPKKTEKKKTSIKRK